MYIASLFVSLFTLVMTIIMAFSAPESRIFRLFGVERAWIFTGIAFVLLVLGIIVDYKDNDFIVGILLDLNMPVKDGFAVLEYMRENNLLSKMPVSIISGDSSKENIDRAFTYEIVDMLSKPFNDQNVKMVIEKTLIVKGKE